LTTTEFFRDLKQQLTGALDETERFEQTLVRLDGTQEGALHQMKEVLRQIRHFVSEGLSQRGADNVEVDSQPEVPVINTEPSESYMSRNQQEYHFGEPIRSRAQAYQMLSEVADYLMKTEPHSPTPYLVRRAVAWGGMTLGELLQQMMRNPSELTELYRLLGLDDHVPKK
jgi:type VI secretion system ImpA family protein